jgi:hypothetical protein
MKNILELKHTDARQFFLKQESYSTIGLPSYFVFNELLAKVSKHIEGKEPSCLYSSDKSKRPKNYDDINYLITNNKDGKYSWRPLQLIHPALYVSLVHKITEEEHWNQIVGKFHEFASNSKIECISIPVEAEQETKQSDKGVQILQWWEKIEQQSIALAIEYEYFINTDITDCYSMMYTHTIPWAIHSKETAKDKQRDKGLIGDIIDNHLRDMSYGQTNGIPQGSILMDFIAEIVLGYADLEVSKKINNTIKEYKILRYRDDYRIFANNPQDAEQILRFLSEVLMGLGLKLNPSKTFLTDDVIKDSIKPDKLYWLSTCKYAKSFQKQLFLIYTLSQKYPNSGSLERSMNTFHKRLSSNDEEKTRKRWNI